MRGKGCLGTMEEEGLSWNKAGKRHSACCMSRPDLGYG